VAVKTTED